MHVVEMGVPHGQKEEEWGRELDNAMQGMEVDRREGGVGVRVGGMTIEGEMSEKWSWPEDVEVWREGEEGDRKSWIGAMP